MTVWITYYLWMQTSSFLSSRKHHSQEDLYSHISKKELLEYVTVVPLDEFKDSWAEAKQISPDPDDVEYLAVALSLNCAIWSKDKDLKEKQSRVKVFSTSDLISFLSDTRP